MKGLLCCLYTAGCLCLVSTRVLTPPAGRQTSRGHCAGTPPNRPLSAVTSPPTACPLPPPVTHIAEGVSLAQAEVWLQLASGRRLVSFPLPDGAFSFADVPAGVHTLTIEHSSLVFPSVRLDVGEGRHGRIVANAADVPGVSIACCVGALRAGACRLLVSCNVICTCCPPPTPYLIHRLPHPLPALQNPALPYPLLVRPMAFMEYFEVPREGGVQQAALIALMGGGGRSLC